MPSSICKHETYPKNVIIHTINVKHDDNNINIVHISINLYIYLPPTLQPKPLNVNSLSFMSSTISTINFKQYPHRIPTSNVIRLPIIKPVLLIA